MAVFKFLKRSKPSHQEDDNMAYNDRIETMRKTEYPMLKGITYLDHGGTTLASKSLLQKFTTEMQANLLANPHSDSSNPSASSQIVAATRLKVLQFFNADPEHFDIVFTANATAAIKLVMDCFSGHEDGFDYCFHRNCHTSLVGVREIALRSHCFASDEETEQWLTGEQDVFKSPSSASRPTLFAYPAQSNMNGQRLPLEWAHKLRHGRQCSRTYTLLDAAAYVSTSPLDLSNHQAAPDFVALSFYKIFGFPDLGALIVRKASAHVLKHRKYFGGGTVDMTVCFGDKPWVAKKQISIHARLEDGTIAIRSILALSCAIDVQQRMYGSMVQVAKHTAWLAKQLYDRLSTLRHANGVFVCHVYKEISSKYGDASTQGATIALNIRRSDGSWWGSFAVGSMLRADNIHVRTGSLCNPGGMACALDISPDEIRSAYNAGFRCSQPDDIREGGVVFGMVRITIGAMSTLGDIEKLATYIETHFVESKKNPRKDSLSCVVRTDVLTPEMPAEEFKPSSKSEKTPSSNDRIMSMLLSCSGRRNS